MDPLRLGHLDGQRAELFRVRRGGHDERFVRRAFARLLSARGRLRLFLLFVVHRRRLFALGTERGFRRFLFDGYERLGLDSLECLRASLDGLDWRFGFGLDFSLKIPVWRVRKRRPRASVLEHPHVRPKLPDVLPILGPQMDRAVVTRGGEEDADALHFKPRHVVDASAVFVRLPVP